MASQIVVSLQSIVARTVDPVKRVVVTVGTFNTDSNASNVIAHTVRMKGTVRTLDPENRQLAEERIRRVAEDTASAFGATAEVTWEDGYPVTINHDQETQHAIDAARCGGRGRAKCGHQYDRPFCLRKILPSCLKSVPAPISSLVMATR